MQNFIRELNGKEMAEMEKYKRELIEWKQHVDEVRLLEVSHSEI